MHDRDHDERVQAEVRVLNRHAEVATLKADCDDLVALFSQLAESQRERLLILMFGED